MNKGTLEYVTEGRAEKVDGKWALFYNSAVVAVSTLPFDRKAFQDLHDQFWVIRKKEIFERDGYRCVDCKSPFNIQCDHIKNRSQGGTHNPENLATRCLLCHEKKTNNRGEWKKSS